MSEVPNPEESQMPQAHSELSRQDKEQIKEANPNEATKTLAKTMFISGACGALKSVLQKSLQFDRSHSDSGSNGAEMDEGQASQTNGFKNSPTWRTMSWNTAIV